MQNAYIRSGYITNNYNGGTLGNFSGLTPSGVMAVTGEAGAIGAATPVGMEGAAGAITGTRACCADSGSRPASSMARTAWAARSRSIRVGVVVICMVCFKRIAVRF